MSRDSSPPPLFSSMPNFRELFSDSSPGDTNLADKNKDSNDRDDTTEGPRGKESNGIFPVVGSRKLYRSSRPDLLTPDETNRFRQLNIRCIVDFRSSTEYRKATGHKLLDLYYPVYKAKFPLFSGFKAGEDVPCVPVRRRTNNYTLDPVETLGATENGGINVKTEENASTEEEIPERKHVLINFFRVDYVWAVYRRAPWYIQLYSLLFLIVDLILQTNYRYFVRVYAHYVLNKEGLLGQYLDMVEYSKGAICVALKLLSEPCNVPAMLNCAHGKDRTGIVTALVLSCLGWSKEHVARDYARSETELQSIGDRIHKEIVENLHMCRTFTTAKFETMMKLLEYIDEKYGSIENYLESMAFTTNDQERLRKNLLG